MDSSVITALVFFLVGMALFAGAGIGFVVGLAVGRRPDEPRAGEHLAPPGAFAAPPRQAALPAAEMTFEAAQQRADAERMAANQEALRQRRSTTSWSVALAFGVIILCCACTFLMAAAVTLGG